MEHYRVRLDDEALRGRRKLIATALEALKDRPLDEEGFRPILSHLLREEAESGAVDDTHGPIRSVALSDALIKTGILVESPDDGRLTAPIHNMDSYIKTGDHRCETPFPNFPASGATHL